MPTTPKIDAADLAAEYGWSAAVLNSNSELKTKFAAAVAANWSPERFVAEVRGTQWYRAQSSTTREWILLQQTDPATAKQRLAQRVTTMQTEANTLGITLTPAQASQIASQSIMLGWDETQVRGAMTKDWNYDPKKAGLGLAAKAVDDIRKSAADYLVPISDQSINDWTHRILAGQGTADDFTEYAKQQAASLFPTIANQIKQGMTVKQFADPYAQIAAQTLGVNQNSIDFTQPKWRKALDQVDPKTNERTIMSLSDWQSTLRKDSVYGYDQSSQGASEASALTAKLAQTFGAT